MTPVKLHHLTALSPFGPIFGKELRTTARRRRTYLLRVLYLGGLMLFLLLAWTSLRSYGMHNQSVAWQTQQQARLGQTFFMMFSMFCVIAMGLIGPVLTSTAISAERLGKTLGVLLMTPISAWQIVAGKLFSRLLVALTLIGLSLPVLALVRLLGGVETSQMFGVVSLCVVTALFGAAVGLLFSTFVDRAYASILLSYALMLLLYLFVPFVMVLTVMQSGGIRWARTMTALNPFFATGLLASGEAMLMGMSAWAPCVLLHLALAAVLVLVSALALRRRARHAGERAAAVDPASYIPIAAIAAPAASPADAASDPAILPYARPKVVTRRQIAPRNVSDNPVLWREIRRPLMNKRWQAIVGAAMCVILLLVTYGLLENVNALNDDETQIGYGFIFNGLIMLLVCVLSGTAIAQEKESDTWTLLLATPISGWAIVWGKVLGQLRKLMWPMLLIIAHFAIFAVAGVIDFAAFFVVIWTIVTFNTIWIATGVYLSLRIHKVTFAVILNLLLPVLMYVAAPIVLMILGELIEGREEWAQVVLWYLPYYYMSEGVNRWDNHSVWLPSDDRVSYAAFVWFNIIAGVVHLALAMGILAHASVYFDRIVGRANQRLDIGLPSPPAA